MAQHPKPARRVVDPTVGLEKLRRERVCRVCKTNGGWLGVTRHHLVKRSQRGDDVEPNIVPLCGHGTAGCHGDVEAYRADARRKLRHNLQADELRYVTAVKGRDWLEKHYPM